MLATRPLIALNVLIVCAVAARADEPLVERSGQHIRLWTDVDIGEADRLVAAFDRAVTQWFQFWELPTKDADAWRVDAYVMRNPARFRRDGLIPARLPQFRFGYAYGNRLWVIAQPGEYYTRHLLLHEGVHALAFDQFGGAGPSWFMEGTAELLATHRSDGPDLTVNEIPRSREEAPHWGRFKILSQRRDEQAVPSVETVMRLPQRLDGDVESYGWSWAAAMLLNNYPDYRPALLAAARNGRDSGPGFTRQLYVRLQPKWPELVARWRIMCHDLDYGFDWDRERVQISSSDPIWERQPLTQSVSAAQGWQSLGRRFPAGARLIVTASETCTIAVTTRPWITTPTGVTIRYHNGRPLGQLLCCVLPCVADAQPSLEPLPVQGWDEGLELVIDQPSWVLFRVNDAVGELADNQSAYEVRVEGF